MAGLKRKSAAPIQSEAKTKTKKLKVDKASSKRSVQQGLVDEKRSKRAKAADESDDLIEPDTSEDENGFYGFSSSEEGAPGSLEDDGSSEDSESEQTAEQNGKAARRGKPGGDPILKKDPKVASPVKPDKGRPSGLAALNATTSQEAHAKQKALAKERKAAKPNADLIERAKKIWEYLRLKSSLEKEERRKLVEDLFDIITERIKDFVFKHDSVRVIQSAVKYSNMEQRRIVARELKGEFRTLAEGKYSKFLVAKLLEKGDVEIREWIISEFYGHVRRLINHPEAAWILDDTYRAIAAPEQKSRLLREWYGPEFSIRTLKSQGTDSAELSEILQESPEKRKPIMDYLEIQINQILQKKQTGFTMLHDAMLQYFLACKPDTPEMKAFLDQFRPDPTLKEGQEADNVDLMKNLAFTKSGSRLVSLALAYGSARDRKAFLKPYKDTIEMMAYDANAHRVLLAALAVFDDTKTSSKSIFGELLPPNDAPPEKVLKLANDSRARVVLLYPFASEAKWLIDDSTRQQLAEVYAIRASTSKKDPHTRLQEIARAVEPQLLTAVSARIAEFASFAFGLQFMSEVLIGAPETELEKRHKALTEVAKHAQQILDGSLKSSSYSEKASDAKTKQNISALGKNTLKTLVQGGKFDPELKKIVPVEPALGFADMFWDQIKDNVVRWAIGQGSFVIVGLVESEDFERKSEVLSALRKERKKLETAAGSAPNGTRTRNEKGQGKNASNAGARILLQKL